MGGAGPGRGASGGRSGGSNPAEELNPLHVYVAHLPAHMTRVCSSNNDVSRSASFYLY
jgi:hypothetical protein